MKNGRESMAAPTSRTDSVPSSVFVLSQHLWEDTRQGDSAAQITFIRPETSRAEHVQQIEQTSNLFCVTIRHQLPGKVLLREIKGGGWWFPV